MFYRVLFVIAWIEIDVLLDVAIVFALLGLLRHLLLQPQRIRLIC